MAVKKQVDLNRDRKVMELCCLVEILNIPAPKAASEAFLVKPGYHSFYVYDTRENKEKSPIQLF